MRQICPHCQTPVDVPDAAAGGQFDCPACGESFPVPKSYAPAVAAETYAVRNEPAPPRPAVEPPAPPPHRPLPPPGYVPPSAAPPQPVAADPGDERTRGLALTPVVVGWVPVACLTLCLLLTFFPWVGAYPGGYRVLSQNAWEAGYGSVHAPAAAVPESLQQAEPEVVAHAPPNLLLLLYCVLLILTVLLAWAERLVRTEPTVMTVPGPLAWLPGVWPYRFALLIGLAALLLVLVLYQSVRGFGLETSVRRYADGKHAAVLGAADTAAKRQVAEIQAGMEAARFAVQPTTARDLAAAAHVVAVLALLARMWLARRGDRPPPRVVVQY
jgi:hypothetical protein